MESTAKQEDDEQLDDNTIGDEQELMDIEEDDLIDLYVLSTDASHKKDGPELLSDMGEALINIQRQKYDCTQNQCEGPIGNRGMDTFFQFCSQRPQIGTYGKARYQQSRNLLEGDYIWIYMGYQSDPNHNIKPSTCSKCSIERSATNPILECMSSLCHKGTCVGCREGVETRCGKWICQECKDFKIADITNKNCNYTLIMQDYYMFRIASMQRSQDCKISVCMQEVIWDISLENMRDTPSPEDIVRY